MTDKDDSKEKQQSIATKRLEAALTFSVLSKHEMKGKSFFSAFHSDKQTSKQQSSSDKMQNTNQTVPETCGADFSQAQRTALAIWARSLSDYRLEITRNQLIYAITAYDANKDDTTAGLALIARMEAVTAEITSRGGVTPLHPICIPWGKSLIPFTEWSLTDYTKVPPTTNAHTEATTAIHLPTVTYTITDDDNPTAPATVIHQPTVTYFLTPNNAPEDSIPVDEALYTILQNLDDAVVEAIHNIAAATGEDRDVTVTDHVNDKFEAETYRLADNDTSGLPIISTDIIDMDNTA